MRNNIFELTTEELQSIALALQKKIEEGLEKDDMEILCVPTHISPRAKEEINNGNVLALDWGGTNFRAAIVKFTDGIPEIIEIKEKMLSAKETVGYKQEDLFREMASLISKLEKLDEKVTQIGYCFSYPAKCELNGDAILVRWTKGIDIPEMIDKPVGEPLMAYLNDQLKDKVKFNNIVVINDTVACLFGGRSNAGYNSYLGLIVGTGNNMASEMRLDKIGKMKSKYSGSIPVNLESGNFNPPYLTVIDNLVDAMSNNRDRQRFEKAISGKYLGDIFKMIFMYEKIKSSDKNKQDFDAEDLSKILTDNPCNFSEEKIDVAKQICERSAKLVAASITGLVQVLVKQDSKTRKIGLAVDGSVFWKTPKYKECVEEELKILLPNDVSVTILPKMADPNLIGSAIAALS